MSCAFGFIRKMYWCGVWKQNVSLIGWCYYRNMTLVCINSPQEWQTSSALLCIQSVERWHLFTTKSSFAKQKAKTSLKSQCLTSFPRPSSLALTIQWITTTALMSSQNQYLGKVLMSLLFYILILSDILYRLKIWIHWFTTAFLWSKYRCIDMLYT